MKTAQSMCSRRAAPDAAASPARRVRPVVLLLTPLCLLALLSPARAEESGHGERSGPIQVYTDPESGDRRVRVIAPDSPGQEEWDGPLHIYPEVGAPGQTPRPEHRPDQRPGYHPGNRPGFRPDHRPDFRPDHRPGFRPDHRPDFRPGNRPGFRPDQRPDHRPDFRPDQRPPGFRPDYRPGSPAEGSRRSPERGYGR